MYKAKASNVRIAPRKMRLLIDLIRGKEVRLALGLLRASPKRGSKVVETLLNSAVANAENRHVGPIDVETLKIKKAFVNEARTLKRFRPRAMGRSAPIRKRSSHITLEVE